MLSLFPLSLPAAATKICPVSPAAAIALCQALMGDTEALAPFGAVPKQATFGSLGLVAAETSYRWRQLNDRIAEALT